MEPLCGIYDVTFLGHRVGTLTVSISGLNTVFDCRCDAGNSGEIQRLNCVSGGVPIAIGVLIPDRNGLHLKKNFTRNALMQLGLTTIESCFLSSAAPQTAQIDLSDRACSWRQATDGDLSFEDSALSSSCGKRTDILARGNRAQLHLAVPIEPDTPFPLMPVFCYGQTMTIQGRNYVVFSLSNGKFVQP